MKLKQALRWVWQTIAGHRFPILLNSTIGVLRVCCGLLFVWISKQLIDIATHTIEGNLIDFSVYLILIVIAEILLTAWSGYIESRNEIRLKNGLKHKLFSSTMLGAWNGKKELHSGDIINRLEEDIRLLADALSKTIPSVMVVSFQLGAAFLFLLLLNHRMAYVMLAIMPIFLILSKVYLKRIRTLTSEIRTTDSDIQSLVQENTQHKVLIQTLEQNKNVASKLSFLQSILFSQTLKRINFTVFSRTLVMAGFATSYVLAFLWGVNGIYKGLISFGTMTAFLQLVGQVQRPMVDLSRYIPSLFQVLTSVDRLKELDDIPQEKQGELQMLDGSIGIRLENVNFTYPAGNKQVLNDFSFNFAPNSRTSIVGETGTGKSTLIRIMLALLEPQQGKVYIYNKANEIEVSPLTRCNMAYVPQGNTLLSGTIRENLALGNPNATDEEIEKVLRIAVAEFINDLPKGLDTPCGEQGAGLSEGQAQRICIARGLLRPGNILLLDEFSSSLDKNTELQLIERLVSKAKDKTLIFITHREVITNYCDQTIHLNK